MIETNFSTTSLERLINATLQSAGFCRETAESVAGHLIEAEMMGVSSHGVVRLSSYVSQSLTGEVRPQAQPRCLFQEGALLKVDGDGGLGIPAMELALKLCQEPAHNLGVAAAGIIDCGHTGRVGAYTEAAAKAGFLAICVGGGGRHRWPNVAPHGGRHGRMSTNPYALGFPAESPDTISCDFATSSIATGKVTLAKALGTDLLPDSAIDKEGRPTNNPNVLNEGGFLLPAAGAKGSGLGVIAELIGGAMLDRVREFNWLMILVRADGFRSLSDVSRDAQAFVNEIHSTPPASGFREVLAPGEPERRRLTRSGAEGIRLAQVVRESVFETARSVGVDPEALLETQIS